MRNQKREIKEAVSAALAEHADERFQANGFRRRTNSLRYRRDLQECTQSVEVYIQHGPKDMPNSVAAVYPYLGVTIPKIETLAAEMAGGEPMILPPNSTTLHQPIEFTSPKGVSARWYLYQPDSVGPVVRELEAFSTRWLFPFLDEYSSVKAVIDMYQNGDRRVLTARPQVLRVIAAMIIRQEYDAAHEIVISEFGRPMLRREYARVHEFVENLRSAPE